MLDGIISTLVGPLGGIMAAIVTAAAAWALGRYTGGRDANTKRDARDARAHIKERGKIDDEISGIGSTDADRIDRLRAIERKRTGKD